MHDYDPEFEWWAFLNGRDGVTSRTVCRLPDDMRRILGARSSLVYIRTDYAQKSAHKHSLQPAHFSMIRMAILYGAAYSDPGGIAFYYEEDVFYKTNFYVVLKTTAKKDEIWVKTFHRKKSVELIRTVKRKTLIRSHSYKV